MKRFIAFLAVLVLCPTIGQAQVVRPKEPIYNLQMRRYLQSAGFPRTVTVAKDGSGDYRSVKEACDFVATQTRSLDEQWAILVYPGTYEEAAFTVPDRAVVRGLQTAAAPTGLAPIITNGSLASGTWITLAGQISDVVIRHNFTATLSGATTALQASGFWGAIYNTQIQIYPSTSTNAETGVAVTSGTFLYLINSQILYAGASGANFTGVKVTGDGFFESRRSLIVTSFGAAKALHHNGSATAYLYQTYIGGGLGGGGNFTIDITSDGGGAVKAYDSTFLTASGSVSAWAPFHLATKTPASAAASCSVGEIAWDSSFIYVCTGANQWKRAALASW